MKKTILLFTAATLLGGMIACSSGNSNDQNTGNGSYESPTNGNPATDSTQKDHTQVIQDTLHP